MEEPDRTPRDLRELLAVLERRGELAVVDADVDARLELAEIHRRVAAVDGPALLFRRVSGSSFPVVTNLFGTRERAELAFGQGAPARVERLVELLAGELPPRLGRLMGYRREVAGLLRLGTRRVRRAPVSEVRDPAPDLTSLPALTCWPEDGGPFLTLPLVLTESPSGKGQNLGIYRMQIHDTVTTGMHWQIGKGGGYHYAEAEAAGRALPVSVILGGPPALMVAAVAPLPENVPELLLASFLLGGRLRVTRGPGAHFVPADAEFVLSGGVPPFERRPEGPFGDHYGYYSLEHDYPVFRVNAVWHRRDAIFPATVVGKPRQEDYYIGELLQELLAPVFPLVMPGVRALWSYGETGFHALAAARVEERYGRESMTAAFRILGEGQLALTKFLLVTDAPVDLRDFPATLQAVLARTDPTRDLHLFGQTAMDTLDYTGPEVNRGSKGAWLGVGEPVRELPGAVGGLELPGGFGEPMVFCPGCLVVSGPAFAAEPAAAERLAEAPGLEAWPLVVLVDDAREAARTPASFLWTVFTRFEPAADIRGRGTRRRGNLIVRGLPVVVDARMKPWYPGVVRCDEETTALVTRRWDEYFPSKRVEMGDSETAHLGPGTAGEEARS